MKKLLTLLIPILLIFCFTVDVYANDTKIIDEANVLSETEEKEINDLINSYISKTNYDIVVYFTSQNSYFEKYSSNDAITRLADDTFDNNGYGIGNDRNGLIMCIDVYYRDYTITTSGNSCINTYTDKALNDMYDNIVSYLSKNDWANAAKTFVKSAASVYDNYDYYHKYKNESHIKEALLPAFIGSSVITLIVFLVLKGQLKHIRVATNANTYIKNRDISISRSRDIYLYTDVTRTRIERQSSSGSSTHTSSSGRSHGGGGSHRF